MDEKSLSLPSRLTLYLLLTIVLVWISSIVLEEYFFVSGGLPAYIILGALLTLMNLVVRPILHILTLPLHFFFTILALILVNGLFLWLTYQIALLMDPAVVILEIEGGIAGWIIIAIVLGIANSLFKHIA